MSLKILKSNVLETTGQHHAKERKVNEWDPFEPFSLGCDRSGFLNRQNDLFLNIWHKNSRICHNQCLLTEELNVEKKQKKLFATNTDRPPGATLHRLHVELFFRLRVLSSSFNPAIHSLCQDIHQVRESFLCLVSINDVSVRGAVIHGRLWEFMGRRGRRGRVADGGLRLPHGLVQLADEVFEVLEAALADLPEVLPEGNLQLLLQVGVFGHQHLHDDAERLAVLPVHLDRDKQCEDLISDTFTHPFACSSTSTKCRQAEGYEGMGSCFLPVPPVTLV